MITNTPLKATDPRQYDSQDLDWTIRGAENRSSRVMCREVLDTVIPSDHLKGKRVIDIGAGVGQLYNWLQGHGAAEVVAIDPSTRNIESLQTKYPQAKSTCTTLHDFCKESGNQGSFDSSFAIFVFEHIENLEEAFADVFSILKPGGDFYLIISDKDYCLINDRAIRGDKFVSVEVITQDDTGTVAAATTTIEEDGHSVIYDIFRPLKLVLDSASTNGMELTHQCSIYDRPDDQFQARAFAHVLAFKKGDAPKG
jgi:SAM-dependent methyltransferase